MPDELRRLTPGDALETAIANTSKEAGVLPTTMLNWSCSTLMTGCPQDPPSIGSACTQSGLVCDYGACIGGEKVICTGGTWANDMGGCPG